MNIDEPKSQREARRLAILRHDRRIIVAIAPIITKVTNWVAVLWLVLFAYALIVGAGEAIVLLLASAIPVLLLWLVGRAMPSVVRSVNKNWS